MTIWNRITATRAATALADWISGGALSEARRGVKENWNMAANNWQLAQERLAMIQRLEAQLRRAEDETRAVSKAKRQQMGQISAELSALIEVAPMAKLAPSLRAIRALTKG